MPLRRSLVLAAFLGVLLAAVPANAAVREVGVPTPFPLASCPDNCQAVGQISGYQVQIGTAKNPFRVGRKGYVVAFTIRLAKPTAEQIEFFNNLFGGPPTARLSVLKPIKKKRPDGHRTHKLLAQSDVFELEDYYGSTPSFALAEPLRIRKGNILGLTLPTWAPAFTTTSLGSDHAWRSSRERGSCDDTGVQAAQQVLDGRRSYDCFYRGARLIYSATFVPDPTPTNETEQERRR
jgi:hypothetical protein